MRPISALPLLLCAALIPVQAAPPALVAALPPNSRIVLGARAGKILELLSAQEGMKDLRMQAALLLAATPWSGFDPFRDIDEVVVATTGTGQNPPTLIMISGRLDASKLGKNGRQYRNAYVIQQPKATQATAILEGGPMLIGDWPLVKAAIDRCAAGAPAAGPLSARIDELRSRYDFWAFADQIDTAAMPAAKAMPAVADPLRSVDRFWLGASFSKDFDFAGELHLRSPEDADKVTAMIRQFEAMARAQMKDSDAAKLDVQTGDGAIRLAISVPEEQWKKALAARNQAGETDRPVVKAEPVATPQVIKTDASGNTVSLTLPGKR